MISISVESRLRGFLVFSFSRVFLFNSVLKFHLSNKFLKHLQISLKKNVPIESRTMHTSKNSFLQQKQLINLITPGVIGHCLHAVSIYTALCYLLTHKNCTALISLAKLNGTSTNTQVEQRILILSSPAQENQVFIKIVIH